eukprot:15441260-Alexandrium_andersonii.AAC.1
MGRSGRAGGCCPRVVSGVAAKGRPGEAGSQAAAASAAAAAPSPQFVAAKAYVLDGGGLLAPRLLS